MLQLHHCPRPRMSSAGAFVIALLTRVEGLELRPSTARRLWEVIAAGDDMETYAFRYATGQVVEVIQTADAVTVEQAVGQYIDRWLTPQRLIEGLETLHLRGALDRQSTTRLQEQVLRGTDARGKWKP
jgi:hypothetical protein